MIGKVVQPLKVSSEAVEIAGGGGWGGGGQGVVIEGGFLEMEFELVFGGWVEFQ